MGTSRTAPRAVARAVTIPAFSLYGEPPRPPDEGALHVEMISVRSRACGWRIAPHRHRDLHQILIVRRGRVTAGLDGRGARVRAPVVIVVPPGSIHAFAFAAGTEGLVLSIGTGVASELASRAPGLSALLACPAVLQVDRHAVETAAAARLGELLLREFGRPAPARALALQGLLGALLANLLRMTGRQALESAAGAAEQQALVTRFREVVERRYREHMAISVYARELDVSLRRLQRACVEAVGQRPIEIVHLRLLLEAERQLRYTSLPVAQIAYGCGFDDPAYFTRFFTRRAKVSPRAFRQDGAACAPVQSRGRAPRHAAAAAARAAPELDTSRGGT